MIRSVMLPAVVFMCVGCAADNGSMPAPASLSGTATYRERMALPPDAVFEATLEDVSRADAPATVIGSTRIESPGNPPIHFTIDYDPAAIVERHRYVVRAKIRRGEALMFTTDTAYPVLDAGAKTPLELLMRRVGATSAGASIEDVEWTLTQLGGAPAPAANPKNPPRLLLHAAEHRVVGSGGCNRMSGSYTLSGQQLKFGDIVSTMMACPSGMEQEHAFHEALAKVTAWRMNGAALELLDSQGQPVVTLSRAQ